jgi:hypothetical protein
MVPGKEVLGYVKAQPFLPFRIRMNSGRIYEIRHPEMIRVGKNTLHIFSLVSDDPDIYDQWETVSLVLIESVAPLETPVA